MHNNSANEKKKWRLQQNTFKKCVKYDFKNREYIVHKGGCVRTPDIKETKALSAMQKQPADNCGLLLLLYVTTPLLFTKTDQPVSH